MNKILSIAYYTVGVALILIAGIIAVPLLLLRYSWEIADRAFHAIESYPKQFNIKL